ncbi:hypothetical protein D9M68_518230 [compost metagenome]
MVGQRTADQHAALQFVGAGAFDAHDHAAVVQQQLVAHAAIPDQVRIVDAHHFLVAGVTGMGDGETEAVAFLQFDALVGELGDADLRALQVAEQGDEAAVFGGQFADQAGACLVFFGAAVGEVQAGDVQSRDDQLLQDFRGVAGRAEGGDDFGAAERHAKTPFFKQSARLLREKTVVIVPVHYPLNCFSWPAERCYRGRIQRLVQIARGPARQVAAGKLHPQPARPNRRYAAYPDRPAA